MTQKALILLVTLPFAAGLLCLLLPKKQNRICALLAVIANSSLAAFLFKKEAILTLPWAGFGMDLILRLYHFSGFIILAASVFSLLVVLYSFGFMKDMPRSRQFYAFLLVSLALVNGAVLSDNLVLLLFFWEGLLVTLYALISTGGRQAFKTATKALVIVGVSDICMMAGIALTKHLAGTLEIS